MFGLYGVEYWLQGVAVAWSRAPQERLPSDIVLDKTMEAVDCVRLVYCALNPAPWSLEPKSDSRPEAVDLSSSLQNFKSPKP